MSLRINRVDAIPVTVNLCYPEDGSVLKGTVKPHFRFVSQAKLDQLGADVADGKITPQQQFRELVPKIEGIPGSDGTDLEGDAVFKFLETDDYGPLIKSAVFSEYLAALSEGRAKNSKTSRGR
jgi:hypothetical protein